MNSRANKPFTKQAAGYEALRQRYELKTPPHWRTSFVAQSSTRVCREFNNKVEEIFPASFWPGEGLEDHLVFALKYDGVNLAILHELFTTVTVEEMVEVITSKPTGKYSRRLWFLYEFLTDTQLPLPDATSGAYVDVLEPKLYFTVKDPEKARRQRVNNNLLGADNLFCPIVRRNQAIDQFDTETVKETYQKAISGFSTALVRRALSYLYTKETKSSFAIESETPTKARSERFVEMLHLAESKDFLSKESLLELQNRIVDPRYRDSDYRTSQIYVGETISWEQERVHFIGPKAIDIPELMNSLIACHQRMELGGVSPLVHAAIVSFAFVYIHPFEDGNGRIHRFLIHNILSRRGVTARGSIFPISASLLENRALYDEALEHFSVPLMTLLDYTLNSDGSIEVHGETKTHYQYLDLTPQTAATCWFIGDTIQRQLTPQLRFLASYDEAVTRLSGIVEMPGKKVNLFIKLCLKNNGTLSKRKQEKHFPELSDNEVVRMQAVMADVYENHETGEISFPF